MPNKIPEGPNAEESKQFWSDIWSVEKERNVEVDLLKNIKTDFEEQGQEWVVITREKAFKRSRKVPNWKVPGKDGVHWFWLKCCRRGGGGGGGTPVYGLYR